PFNEGFVECRDVRGALSRIGLKQIQTTLSRRLVVATDTKLVDTQHLKRMQPLPGGLVEAPRRSPTLDHDPGWVRYPKNRFESIRKPTFSILSFSAHVLVTAAS